MITTSHLAKKECTDGIQFILSRLEPDVWARSLDHHWAASCIERNSGSEHDQVLYIYIYIHPEYVAAQAIADGRDPIYTLQRWQTAIGHMLADFRHNQRKSLLVEASRAVRCLGGQVSGIQAVPTAVAQSSLRPSTIVLGQGVTHSHIALARVLIQDIESVKQIYSELACTAVHLLSPDQLPISATQLNEQLRADRADRDRLAMDACQQRGRAEALNVELLQLKMQLKEHERDVQMLLSQLHLVQQEYEQLALRLHERDRLAVDACQQRGRAEALNAELLQLKMQLKEHERDVKMLLSQLHLVQQEYEQLALRLHEKELGSKLEEKPASLEVGPMQTQQPPKTKKMFHWWSNKKKRALISEVELIKSSSLFDEAWYLKTYPDVLEAKMDAAIHYLKHGWAEGRNPGPQFDTKWYLSNYPDVSEKGMNPLVHYLKFGRNEGRYPAPYLSGYK